jgi:molybdate transport system substrate-binding protein
MTARLSVISSMATRRVLAEIAGLFEQRTGAAIDLVSIGGVDAAKRIRAGEAFDVAVLAADALAALADEGHVDIASCRAFALSPAALAVRRGGARPERCDGEAIRAFIMRAQSVGVSTGPSGVVARKLLATWACPPPIVEARPGEPVARLVAIGQAEIGIQQLSELVGEAGIDIACRIPADLLALTTFSAGRCRAGVNAKQADAFLRAVAGPEAAACLLRHGMEPPPPPA